MTANPALHRFFAFMAARALDPDAQLPAHDLQVQHTLSCPFGHKDQAQTALNQLSEQCSVQQQVCHHVALHEFGIPVRCCKHQELLLWQPNLQPLTYQFCSTVFKLDKQVLPFKLAIQAV